MYARAPPASDSSDPPRGVLYDVEAGNDALRSAGGCLMERGERSNSIVGGGVARGDG